MKLVLSKTADRDLDQIQNYFEDAEGSSAWIVQQPDETFMHLLQCPHTGHHRLELLSSEYLFWTLTPYVIVYTIRGDDLIVVTIRHGSRDLTRLASLLHDR